MNQDMSATPAPVPEQPRKSNTWIIIAIGVLILCCLCLIVVWAAWQYGDAVIQWLGQLAGSTP